MFKLYTTAISIAVLIVGLGLFLSNWHYSPIKKLKAEVNTLQRQLDTTASALNICEVNITKQKLQGYISGVGKDQDEIINIDFNNAVY